MFILTCLSNRRTILIALLFLLVATTLEKSANAQIATYHLHKEASSTTGLFQLKTTGPDAAAFAIQSANLKNQPVGEYVIKAFDTQSGVPNRAGVIPAGATITFTLWMRKTSTSGLIYPRAKLFVNNASGTLIGTTTGATALTNTLVKYTLSVTAASTITMVATDRFYLWVGVNVATAPTTNTNGELDVEGTLNGNYNSQVMVPLPTSPPTVSITSPANGASFNGPTNITISATAADSDGTISKVEFFQGSTKIGEKIGSPYDFSWTNVPPASYGYSLTAKATDNAGATTTSSPINIIVSGAGSLFDNSVGFANSTPVNLTGEGSTDWAHWGLNTVSSYDRKSGGTQISNYSLIGTAAVQRLTDSQSPASWTNGTPTASTTNTATGIFTSALGNGFQITVPADTTLKTLRLYVGYWNAQAKIEATLSDSSAPAVVDTSFGAAGFGEGVFTINFKSASASQTLTVKYTIATDYSPPFGNIRFKSATLSVPTSGVGSLTGGVATPASTINLTNEGSADWTHWGMGSATAFNHKTGIASQISSYTKLGTASVLWLNDNPTVFSWNDGTPTSSASNTPTGVFIQGVGSGFQFSVPADTETKILKIYLGVWRARGKLEATLSDGSAAAFSDSSLNNATGTSNGVYTITFKAGSDGQSLRIRYTDINDYISGANVTLEAATLAYAPPAIASLSANSGPVGTVITLTGSNFGLNQGNGTVTFNGIAATPTSWSSTSIVVAVPASATTGPIIVTAHGAASNSQNFTVAPGITGLSPVSGAVGDSITINGTTFGATQGASTLTFNGTAATPTSWSATSIVAPVPSGATTGPVVVTVGGSASNSASFSVGPKITGLAPASGGIGDSVTINGTTFGATQGTSTVTFNGTAATPTSWSATSIAVPVPSGATTGPVVVTVGSLASSGVSFTVAPKINGLSPASGEIGNSVTISGTSFGASQGTSTVSFNGVIANPTSWNDTNIVVPVPSTSTGPVVVTVGGSASNGTTFTVTSTGTVTGRVTVAGGTTPIPGATVKAIQGTTVVATTNTNGTGDYTLSSLTVGTYAIEASASGYGTKRQNLVTVQTTETATVNLGLDAVVSGPVSYIYDAAGRLVSTVGPIDTVVYSYDAVGNLLSISRQSSSQVSIIQFSPNSGPIGTTVTISGTGFSAIANQNTVTFNGVGATVTSATPTQIVTTVPLGATTGPVSVTSPSGSATSATSFTVGASASGAPSITSFAPTIGPAGTAVTINGTNFETIPPNNKVKFNLTRAGVTSASATTMVSSVPNATSGRISVTTPYGSATSTADFYLTPSPYVAADVEVTDRMGFGESRIVSIPTANKVGMIIFDGTAGQRVSLKMSDVTFNSSNVTIHKPDSTTLATATVNFAGGFFEPQTLPTTGTYTIFVDPVGSATGSMLINLYNVPADVSGSIVIGGSSVPVSLGTPGQNGAITFEGTTGQKVSLSLTSVAITQLWVYVNNPDGSTLSSRQMAGVYGDDMIGTLVLPANGTYSILLNPTSSYTGNITLTLNDNTDIEGTIAANGTPTVQSINTPGTNANLSFTGTAGQRVALHISGISYTQTFSQGSSAAGGNVSIINPDSSTLTSIGFTVNNVYINSTTLPASGTYKILVDPHHANTGNVTLALHDVPADFTATVQINDPPLNVPLNAVGQHAQISFAGTAGQQTTVRITNNTIVGVRVKLLAPDGSQIYVTNFGGDANINLPMPTLPANGTYTVIIDPYIGRTGSLDLRVTIP